MRPLLLCVAACLATPALALAGAVENARKLDTAIAAKVANGFRGQVAIEVGGDLLLNKGYGAARNNPEKSAATDGLYYIGSVAKTMTSAAVLQLASEKKLALTDPISRHLPGVPADKAAITIEHLLLHTSGLPANHTDPLARLDRDAFLKWALSQPLGSEPGQTRSYSNIGYSVLAVIVERLEKKPFADVVRDRVFKPANMRDTWFLDDPALPRDRLAFGAGPKLTQRGGKGDPVEFGATWLRNGCGGIVSTSADLVRFGQALRAGRVLNPDQYRLATTPHLDGWGYGWRISRTRRDTPLHFHDGGFLGFNSGLVCLPSEKATIVVLCNHEDQAEPVMKQILKDLFAQ